jgi:hypothetical protein
MGSEITGRTLAGFSVDVIHIRRESVVGLVIVLQGDSQLAKVIDALCSPGRLACGLNGRQQQGDKNADDCDYD